MSWLSDLRDVLGYVLWRIGDTDVTVSSLLVLAVTIFLFVILARLVGRGLHALLVRRTEIGPGGAFAVTRISQYAIAAIGFLVSFQLIGLDVSSLALILGALGIGIGFGLQNITSNFIAGLLILFERPITVGDRVRVGDIEGDVTAINMRATTVLSVTNLSVIVPNSEFISSTVVNYSHGDPRLIVNVDVGVSYLSDLDVVVRSLLEVAAEHPRVLPDPQPEVRFLEFGDSAWQMQLRVWIPIAREHPAIRSDLNKAIVTKFREHGVEIPYPQRDLNWRSPMPIPVRAGAASEESEPA
jgi:small-conductance mechanosensitive channel